MMVMLQALFAFLLRSAGKVVNTAFGWATVMLFGKVPQRRQIYLSVLALGSLVWLLAALGILFPRFAAFMLAFVTLPEWLHSGWIRLAMLALAALLPALLGYLTRFVVDPPQRPQGVKAQLRAIARGYPYALGLALTLVMMLLIAPLLQISYMVRRQSVSHVPVMIDARDYLVVLGEIQNALRAGGIETVRRPATWLLRGPTWMLTVLAGGVMEKLVAGQLSELRSPSVKVLIHPSDVVLIGKQFEVARARAVLSENLTFSRAHMTWSKEGNQLEDRLVRMGKQIKADELTKAASELQSVQSDLRSFQLPYEEWEVLFRELLIVERALLRGRLELAANHEQVSATYEERRHVLPAQGNRRTQ